MDNYYDGEHVMNSNTELNLHTGKVANLKNACLSACRKVVAQMSRAKESVLAEFRDRFQVPEHLVRLALNEAEALAWQTAYPHLVFPNLATEKAQALVNWQGHQRAVSRGRLLAATV
jgi:hypothetical protein